MLLHHLEYQTLMLLHQLQYHIAILLLLCRILDPAELLVFKATTRLLQTLLRLLQITQRGGPLQPTPTTTELDYAVHVS